MVDLCIIYILVQPKSKIQQVAVNKESNKYNFPRKTFCKNLDDSKDTKNMKNTDYDSLSKQMFDIELSMH